MVRKDSFVAATKKKFSFRKRSQDKDSLAFVASLFDHHISHHSFLPCFLRRWMNWMQQDAALQKENPAWPYELRFIHFTLLTKPSTIPLLQSIVPPWATPSASWASALEKAPSGAIPLEGRVASHSSSPPCPSRFKRNPPGRRRFWSTRRSVYYPN